MLHLPSFITGLKIARVKRMINMENTGKWKCFFEYYLKHLGGDLFWSCNLKWKDTKISNVRNFFIREILLSWSALTFSDKLIEVDVNILDQVLWNNSLIKIDGNVVFKHNWIDNGIIQIRHLVDDHGTFYSHTTFMQKCKVIFLNTIH